MSLIDRLKANAISDFPNDKDLQRGEYTVSILEDKWAGKTYFFIFDKHGYLTYADNLGDFLTCLQLRNLRTLLNAPVHTFRSRWRPVQTFDISKLDI